MAPKTVLITGCSTGIGSALALEFHAQGHTVFATTRDPSKTEHLASRGITCLPLDVTSESSIASALATVSSSTGGRLDILVNNAGINHVLPFADTSPASFSRVISTNFISVASVTHAFLPLLVSSGGVIAVIGSVNHVLNPPFQSAYNASKAGVASLCDTWRVELAPLGVRVVHVVTGAIESQLFQNADAKAGEEAKVPGSSWYAPIKDKIEAKAFLDGVAFTPAEVYAKRVVKDLTAQKPAPVIWRGATATLMRFLGTFAWKGALDGPLQRRVGLNTLRPPPQTTPGRDHQD